MQTNQNILTITNLEYQNEGEKILTEINLVIDKGDYVALAGPNGAGKTTLARLILGLIKAEEGQIRLFNKELKNFIEWEKIGYLPQRINNYNILLPAKAEEVVSLGLLSLMSIPKRFTEKEKIKVQAIMKKMGIYDLRKKLISELSGGQQQRVFLARALICNPEFLILDEPSSALDSSSREHFYSLLDKLNIEEKITILLISHDIGHIKHHACKMIYLDKKILYYGDCKSFLINPTTSQHYEHYF